MPVEPLPTAVALLVDGRPPRRERPRVADVGPARRPLPARSSSRSACSPARRGSAGIAFEDYRLAFRVGTVALVLILFDGGLNTSIAAIRARGRAGGGPRHGRRAGHRRRCWRSARARSGCPGRSRSSSAPSSPRPTPRRSSRSCAARGIQVRARVAHLLELESGVNDPMAVILTLGVTQALVERRGREPAVVLARPCSSSPSASAGGARRRLRRPLAARPGAAHRDRALPGPHARHRLHRLRRADAPVGERLPRRVRRGGGARATGPSPTSRGSGASTTPWRGSARWRCSSCSACSPSRRGSWASPARGSPSASSSRSWRARSSSSLLLAPFRVPRGGGGLHQLGGAARRGAHHARHLPGARAASRARATSSTSCSSSWW